MFENFDIREIESEEIHAVEEFLEEMDLVLEEDVEYTAGIFKSKKLIGTGSFAGSIIKCIGTHPDFQGEGLTSKIVTHLLKVLHSKEREHVFLFTKPSNIDLFAGLGFKLIEKVPMWFALMEIGPHGIEEYTAELKRIKSAGTNGGIVINCNPFTLGHRYLIEKAAKEVDTLYLFVVEEDLSLFPFKERFRLIKEGLSDIENVLVVKGGKYIISRSTFPNYFVRNRESSGVVRAQTILDIRIFARYIAKTLEIEKRFVGTEPYCNTTNQYNETMKEVLPEFGIELIEIPRKETEDGYISASTVRDLIRDDKLEDIKKLVPRSTYDFLLSHKGQEICKKIRESDSRH